MRLIVVGAILSFVDAWLQGFRSPLAIGGYVVILTGLNLVLIFGALMIAVRLLDLGLGSLGTASLKIVAVAILPAAVSGIIGHWTFGLMTWSIAAVCYYFLLYYLFEMDGQEMMIVTSIIFCRAHPHQHGADRICHVQVRCLHHKNDWRGPGLGPAGLNGPGLTPSDSTPIPARKVRRVPPRAIARCKR